MPIINGCTCSKRALVAWEKICLPKASGGLGIVNLSIWNKAALCKLCWKLFKEKDAIWIKWIHGFYIKNRDFQTMTIPTQCCWMIRKIMEARRYLEFDDAGIDTMPIKKMYLSILGERTQVGWSKMLSHNAAPAKFVFISWLVLHRGLATCEYLSKIGIVVKNECCLCGQEEEKLEHLFFDCNYSGELWEQLTRWCGIGRRRQCWDLERNYLLQQCGSKSGKQTMYRSVIAVAIYLIWKERNGRRMKGECKRVEEIIHQGKILMASCGFRNKKIGRILGMHG